MTKLCLDLKVTRSEIANLWKMLCSRRASGAGSSNAKSYRIILQNSLIQIKLGSLWKERKGKEKRRERKERKGTERKGKERKEYTDFGTEKNEDEQY